MIKSIFSDGFVIEQSHKDSCRVSELYTFSLVNGMEDLLPQIAVITDEGDLAEPYRALLVSQ